MQIGKKAALKHPEAKLRALVNHVDNFALWIESTIEAAIMDEVCLMLDAQDIQWVNENCSGAAHKSKIYAKSIKIAHEVWAQLRA